jgi:3-hydroxyacyl-CoA dehydrogenase
VRKDVPGFLWNRLQLSLLRECLHLLAEGMANVEAIDTAITDGLAPRWVATGPFVPEPRRPAWLNERSVT